MLRKRIIALGLTVSLAAGALAGCGNSGSQTGESSQTSGESSAADTAADGAGEAAESDAAQGSESSGAAAENSASDGEQVTLRFAWWGGQERADLTNEAVELFMERNLDIIGWECGEAVINAMEGTGIKAAVSEVFDRSCFQEAVDQSLCLLKRKMFYDQTKRMIWPWREKAERPDRRGQIRKESEQVYGMISRGECRYARRR